MTKELKVFANNLNDGLKAKLRDAATKRIETLLAKADLTCNDIAALVGVSHGSIKARSEKIADVAGIVDAVLSGARSSTKKKPSEESVKTFLSSMSPEEREKFLAELNR